MEPRAIVANRPGLSYDPVVHTLRVLQDLPPGFCVEEAPGGILALNVGLAAGFHACGFGPDRDGQLVESELAGRRPLHELRVGEQRFVVRSFHHGGFLRGLTGRRFLDPERPFNELILAHKLNRAGLPTPSVVAARMRYAPLFGFHLDVVSRRIEGALDVGRTLGRVQRGELEPVRVRGLYRALGRLVRAMHKRRVLHADLTPRNILVREADVSAEDPRLWVLDLDRSEILDELGERDRLDNLRRLARHLERMQRAGGDFLTRSDMLRFLLGYHGGSSERKGARARGASAADRGEASVALSHGELRRRLRRQWKTDWHAIARSRSRHRAWHAIGWWFDRRLGRLATLPASDTQVRSQSSKADPWR